MNFNEKYYYVEVKVKNKLLPEKIEGNVNLIKKNELYSNIFDQSDYNYLILEEYELLGFFSLKFDKKEVKITSLYICRQHRKKSIATEVINDIIWSIKYNSRCDAEYILVNSFVESAIFFLKKGFDFCKINKKLDYKKKNIIVLYKEI